MKGKAKAKSAVPEKVTAPRARADWRAHAEMIAERVRLGLPLSSACEIEGVSYDTVRDAISRGDPDAACIVRGRVECEAELVADLREHSRNGRPHNATSYLLERLNPKRWRQADQLEVSGPDGGPVRSETVTEDQLRARVAMLAKKLGGGE